MTDTTTANPDLKLPRANDFAPASFVRWAIGCIMLLLIMPVSIVALLSGLGIVRLPYEMLLLAQRAPFIFPLHMVASAGALALLGPTIMLRNRPHLHRALGRTVGVFVVVGGLTAIPVAIVSSSGVWARAGFFVQGLVWLSLLGAGWKAIQEKRRADHARMMLAMAAVTTGAVWFRLIIGAALHLRLPFEPAYALAAWIGWLVPLCLVLYAPWLSDWPSSRRAVPSPARG